MDAKSGLVFALLSMSLIAAPVTSYAKKDAASEEDGDNEASEDGEEPGESEMERTADTETSAASPIGGYGEDGYFLSDGGVNRLHIGGRVQVLGQYTSVDGGSSRAHQHAFSLTRARLNLSGTAYTERLSYRVQTHFDQGQIGLKDFFLDYRLGEGQTRVRMGQFKMGFTRQFIQSSAILEFVDRSIVNDYIGNERDIGFQIHNDVMAMPGTEWSIGFFNGTGDTSRFTPTTATDPTTMETEIVDGSFSNIPEKIRPAMAIRVGKNSNGMSAEPYSEADMTGAGFRYSVGAGVLTHFRYGAGAASTRAGVDFLIKSEGISASGGIFADLAGPKVSDLSYTGVAAWAQTGYMLSKTKQVALLYATIAKDGGDNQQEVSAAFSHFEFGHNLKWQADITLLHNDDGTKRQDIRGRSQVQLAF